MKHKIISREMEYVSMDCYGYKATCSCGKKITAWFKDECEFEAQKHIDSFVKESKQ